MLCLWINKSRTEDAACACCCTASIALYYTHMGVMPGVVECLDVLLRRFLWHAGSQKITSCLIQYLCKTNKKSLTCMNSPRLVHSPSHSAPHLFHPRSPGHPLVPSSQRLVSNLRSRLAATAAEQVPLVNDSLIVDPGRFTTKLKRSYPGPWLAIAASPTAGVSMSCTGYVANTLYFLVIRIVL